MAEPTPIPFRSQDATLHFVERPTPLGALLLAGTARGIRFVHLGDTAAEGQQALQQTFANSTLQPAAGEVRRQLLQAADALQHYLCGAGQLPDLPLDLRATAFQQRVWQALRAIPHGETRTYTELARAIGAPRAVRAVAAACAANPVALLVPCHRVVGRSGALTGYRWGVPRKRALLAMEGAAARTPFPGVTASGESSQLPCLATLPPP